MLQVFTETGSYVSDLEKPRHCRKQAHENMQTVPDLYSTIKVYGYLEHIDSVFAMSI